MAQRKAANRLKELFVDPRSAESAEAGDLELDPELGENNATHPERSSLPAPAIPKSLTPDIIMQTGDFTNIAQRSAITPFVRSLSADAGNPGKPEAGCGTLDLSGATMRADASLLSTASDHRLYTRGPGNVRRWSQTLQQAALKSGRQTIREKSIQFMPSRQNVFCDGPDDEADGDDDEEVDGDAEGGEDGGGNCSRRGTGNAEVEQLTQEIEQHEHLMDLTAQSEQQRIETLRALPKPLAIKRVIKSKLSLTISNKSAQRPIGSFRRWRYAFAMWINRTEQSTSRTLINLELWYGRLKRIEGNCGSAVGTYFKFLRQLFVMNAVLAVLAIGFVVFPQCLYNSLQTVAESTGADIPEPEADASDSGSAFHVADLFTAQGFMANSVIFYGAYSPASVNVTQRHFYSLPHAYFLTITTLYVATFLVVSIIVARSYRRSFIETAVGVLPNLYAQRLFAAWDFSITSAKAAHLKHHQIYTELREVLADIQQPAQERSLYTRVQHWLRHALVHSLVVAALGGIGYGMWLLLHLIDAEQRRDQGSRLSAMYVAVAACGTLAVLQAIFGWLAALEQYASGRTRLHITLLRCYALELVLGGVLLVFWLTRSEVAGGCWESEIGREIYRIVVVDFVVFVCGGLVWNGVRWAVWRWCWPAVGLPEFDIARGSLGLVFNQTLLWMGMLYSPPLAALMVVKMLVTFYAKELSLMCFCRPATSMWRSAQTATLFLGMVFVSLLAVMTTNGFIITSIHVSPDCGPFRPHQFMIDMFIADVLQLQREHLFWRLFLWVTKPAVIGGVLLFMAAITFYMRAKSRSNIGMVRILKDMLAMEGADKDFLLREIARVTHGRDEMFTMLTPAARKARRMPSRAESVVRLRQNGRHGGGGGGNGNGSGGGGGGGEAVTTTTTTTTILNECER